MMSKLIYQGHELDADLLVDLEDQYFLPNALVPIEVFLALVGGENRASTNWLKEELMTHCLN